MDKLKDFIGHLQSSDDNNFTSAAATLLSMVSDKVSSYYFIVVQGTCRINSVHMVSNFSVV